MRSRSLVVLLGLLLLLPSGAARWYAYGTHEPDNRHDDPTYMWHDAPGEARDRVYFNVVTTYAYTSANPNLGLLGTSQETYLTEYHEALFGRWIDCNGDGYVGMFETLVREYPSALLLDDARCPATSGAAGQWGGAANYNGWVTELTPIATQGGSLGDDRVFRDPTAHVWGDHGLPGEPVSIATCALQRFPPGGARSTGRMLDHGDCLLSAALAWRSADENDRLAGLASTTGLVDLPRTHGSWTAHPVDAPTFGDEDAGTLVHVYDCDDDAERIYLTDGTPPGWDLDHVYVKPPAVPSEESVDPSGSLAGTLLYLSRSVATPREADACYTNAHSNERESIYGVLEGDARDATIGLKDGASWQFQYRANERGSGLARAIAPGDSGAASDLGVSSLGRALAPLGPQLGSSKTMPSGWYADSANLRKVPSLVRLDLADPRDLYPSYQIMTFYARADGLASKGLRLPTDATHMYGREACGESVSGIHHGWECDPARWYPERGGSAPAHFPRPGSLYHLRDVDCHDGGNDLGVQTGLPAYGPRPCPE